MDERTVSRRAPRDHGSRGWPDRRPPAYDHRVVRASRESADRRRRPSSDVAEPRKSNSRRLFWVVGTVAALATVAFRSGWSPGALFTRKPARNVLLITVDTTRADHLSCYGGTATQTPNMDRLAREGALLRNCATS